MTTGKLTDRWRPDHFDKVVGQTPVVSWCFERLTQNDPQSAIFFGPSGCGKNTLARLYGRSLACTSPTARRLACGQCDACSQPMDGLQNGFYAEVPCAEIRTKAALTQHLDSLGHATWVGRRRIIVIDETQYLKESMQGALLRLVEKPPRDSVILILTTDFEVLIPALRSRVSRQQFLPISREELIAYGKRVCIGESIGFEEPALELIARYSKGQARDLLQMIDDVSASNLNLTEEAVHRHHLVGADAALTVLVALLNGDLKQASAAISKFNQAAAGADELFHTLLTAIEYRTRQIQFADDELSAVSAAVVSALLEAGRQVADRHGVDQRRIWAEIREIWQRSPARSLSDLREKLLRVYQWLHERQPVHRKRRAVFSRASIVRERTASRRRPHRRPEGTARGDNSLDQVKRVWDSASLMSQVYGVYFNSRVVIRPSRLGFKDDRSAQNFVGKLIKGLAGRIHDWRGADIPLHWAYTLTGSGGAAVYIIALAIPDDLFEFAGRWLETFLSRRFDELRQGAVSLRWTTLAPGPARGRYQVRLLRLLCRGVNNKIIVRTSGGKRLLADIIGLPRRLRGADERAVASLKAAYVSKSIGRSEVQKWKDSGLPALTPAKDGAWDYSNPGWELDEYRDRRAELDRRIVNQFNLPSGARVMAGDSRARQLRSGVVHQTVDAKDRVRSWPTPETPGWWQPAYLRSGAEQY